MPCARCACPFMFAAFQLEQPQWLVAQASGEMNSSPRFAFRQFLQRYCSYNVEQLMDKVSFQKSPIAVCLLYRAQNRHEEALQMLSRWGVSFFNLIWITSEVDSSTVNYPANPYPCARITAMVDRHLRCSEMTRPSLRHPSFFSYLFRYRCWFFGIVKRCANMTPDDVQRHRCFSDQSNWNKTQRSHGNHAGLLVFVVLRLLCIEFIFQRNGNVLDFLEVLPVLPPSLPLNQVAPIIFSSMQQVCLHISIRCVFSLSFQLLHASRSYQILRSLAKVHRAYMLDKQLPLSSSVMNFSGG